MEHSTPEGQRSAVTRLGLIHRNPSRKLWLLSLWLRRAESFQEVWKFRGTSWAGRAVADRLLLCPGRPGSLQVDMECSVPPVPALGGAKSRQGMWREPPWLSRLSARETWEVIGTSGHKANSLYWAPEQGWAVSGFGTANLRAWDCALLSPPNMQHTSLTRNGSGTSACLLRLGFLRVWAGQRSLTQPGGFGLCCSQPACPTPACSVTFPK